MSSKRSPRVGRSPAPAGRGEAAPTQIDSARMTVLGTSRCARRRRRAFTLAAALLGLCLGAVGARAAEPEPNLLPNPGFEEAAGWEGFLRDGAEGEWKMNAGAARAGRRSLYLAKRNGLGYIDVTTAAPVPVKAGVRYTLRGYFHSEDAPVSALLLFRMAEKEGDLYYDAIDRSAGWMSQSLLINSPPGRWEKRVITYRPDRDREIHPHLVLYGNPCSVRIDDLELTAEPYRVTPKSGTIPIAHTREEALRILEERPEATARVEARDGRTQLLLEGRPVPPVLYKGEPYRTSGDYQGFSKAGIQLATVGVRLGGVNNLPGFWTGKGSYDLASAEEAILIALRKNPQARLILDVWFYPYREWGDENPDDCWRNENGERGYGFWGNLDGFTDDLGKVDTAKRKHWWYPSYQSPRWRSDAAEAAQELVRRLRATPYWKSVAGFFVSGGHDGQFQVLAETDHSASNRARFQEWCRARYGTEEQLSRAWGTRISAFPEIAVPPGRSSGRPMEADPPYLSLGPGVDYREYSTAAAWELRDHFAGVLKRAAEKPVVTLAYGNPPQYHFDEFLNLPNLDACGSMSYYPYRNPGYAAAYKPENSFALHGKLFFQELDLRSWASEARDEIYEIWVGAGDTPERWRAIHRKLVGVSLANKQGYWYYDMNRYFDDPEILAQIAATNRVAERLMQRPRPAFRPDVCLVRAADGGRYFGAYFNAVHGASFYQRMLLETSGVPYDTHTLRDVLSRPELQRYKVYILAHTTFLTSADRSAVEQKLKRDRKTLVWVCDSGYLTEEGKSVDALSALVGMRVKTEETYARLTPRMAPPDHPLARGTLPFQGMSEMFLWVMHKSGPSAFTSRYQPFWVEDPKATPLATYAENGRVAMAVRELPGWTSVYLAAPCSLGPGLLNNIARGAGAYVCGRPGQSIQMNGGFASLHGMRTEEYTFRLPPGVRQVIDPATGDTIARNVETIDLPVVAQQTYWLLFE